MKIISLGWGVQSFTLAAMVALGELESVDAAIHADTRHERQDTYRFAGRWTLWLKERGVNVVTVKSDNTDVVDPYGGLMIPAYMYNGNDKPAQFSRQCTDKWKRAPLRRWLQANRHGAQVEQWIGISLDEFQRMKDSDVKYITNRWPLIEKQMTRADCVNWLRNWMNSFDLEIPPKSSCTFCPFHNFIGWHDVKQNPHDWKEALEVDRAIRKARPPYDLFVSSARIPLEDVDLRTPQERGQMELWANWDDECSGICGV